ncbi:hypothetical protein [Paraburkholderia youngii]|uniref:hypothetical protein n=1 Tax=Paraburkholderia youngii TaxID=2782701 RepID=UPI003D2121BE
MIDPVVCIVRERHASLDNDWNLDAWLHCDHIDPGRAHAKCRATARSQVGTDGQEIGCGQCRIRLERSDEWKTYGAGETFSVAA